MYQKSLEPLRAELISMKSSLDKDLIALTGYNFQGDQFFYTIRNFVKNGYDKIKLERYLIPIKPAQIEGVKIIDEDEFWISSESEDNGKPRLFRFKLKPD